MSWGIVGVPLSLLQAHTHSPQLVRCCVVYCALPLPAPLHPTPPLVYPSLLLPNPVTQLYDYVFSENGLMAYKDGKHFSTMSIKENMGEANIKTFVNFCLRYMADLDIPKKRCSHRHTCSRAGLGGGGRGGEGRGVDESACVPLK